jgi:hypothetical protein
LAYEVDKHNMSDPLYQRFCQQKARAGARGILWKLLYWEWLQIWQDSGHLDERGRCGGEWVMGRNGDIGPYSYDNVKIIRVETNNELANRGKRRDAYKWLPRI